MPERCGWVPLSDAVYVRYHDMEWGAPLDDRKLLFELLCLEGAQAGLSWRTILHRREGYRRAFLGFDPATVAAFGEDDVQRLLQDASIVRSEAKIRSVVANACALLDLEASGVAFSDHVWSFVGGTPVLTSAQGPAMSPAATELSRDLKRRGFRFVGPTICHSFMQAAGLVMEHEAGCFRHLELNVGGPGRRAWRRGAVPSP